MVFKEQALSLKMSKKAYNGLEYYAQEIQGALAALLKKEVMTDVKVKHSFNSDKNKSYLSYRLSGVQIGVSLCLSGGNIVFESDATPIQEGSNRIEFYRGKIEIEKTKTRRLSGVCTSKFARENLEFLKAFHFKYIRKSDSE